MAFMVQGHVPGKGKYGETMRKKALATWLPKLSNARMDILSMPSGTFYQHALQSWLQEAWGQSKNPAVGPAVRAGTRVILSSQNKEGAGDIVLTLSNRRSFLSQSWALKHSFPQRSWYTRSRCGSGTCPGFYLRSPARNLVLSGTLKPYR